jgi:hypothetical protein
MILWSGPSTPAHPLARSLCQPKGSCRRCAVRPTAPPPPGVWQLSDEAPLRRSQEQKGWRQTPARGRQPDRLALLHQQVPSCPPRARSSSQTQTLTVLHEINAMTITCMSAGPAGSSRSLPSWGSDCCQHCCQVIARRWPPNDGCGTGAKVAASGRQPWTARPLIRSGRSLTTDDYAKMLPGPFPDDWVGAEGRAIMCDECEKPCTLR